MKSTISNTEKASKNIARLIDYATSNLYLDEADCLYAQNQLLNALQLKIPYTDKLGKYDFYEVLEELSEFAISKKLCDKASKENFKTYLIGFIMPMPSKVIEMFDNVARFETTNQANKMLFDLETKSGYINKPALDKNIIWENDGNNGKIIITINLAKPEKTPEQVKLAKESKCEYPKCPLCEQNVGFAGNEKFVARQNLRIIPFELNGEDWFMQFSPYQYFEEHIIAICSEHRPMNINNDAFARMLDFVDLFPEYFIGSNAALPIVGGSILAHDHYQGGKKVLPVFDRESKQFFSSQSFPEVSISIVDWYNSIVRLTSKNKKQILEATEKIRTAWDIYNDENCDILCNSKIENETIQHNAITPIASINSDKEYEFDLILRNNRTDEKHPYGIFHPAEELHNIKQESIGIIEVMGLFILPGRLSKEANQIRDILMGKTKLDFEAFSQINHPLRKHISMIAQLATDFGTSLSENKANKVITDYINNACERILDTTAVFKNTENGQSAFEKFINYALKN